MERKPASCLWRDVWEFPAISDGLGTNDLLWEEGQSIPADFRTTKVRDDSIAGVIDENILGPEITMNDTDTVESSEANSLSAHQLRGVEKRYNWTNHLRGKPFVDHSTISASQERRMLNHPCPQVELPKVLCSGMDEFSRRE